MQYPNNIQLTLAIGGDETKSIKGNTFDIYILVFILYFLDRLNNTRLCLNQSYYFFFILSITNVAPFVKLSPCRI